MPLPPSRKDFTGPPPRDVSDLAKITRHHGSYLRRLDPGFLGGTRGTPSPVRPGPSMLVGGDAGGDADSNDIAFINTDRTSASAAGTISLFLTYEPIDGSLHIYWNGLYQEPGEYVLDGQLVTFINAHIHVDDVLSAAYAYEPTDDPLELLVRGTSRNVPTAPVETVPGDFLIVATRNGVGSTVDFSIDPRLTERIVTPAEFKVWTGVMTSLAPLAYTGSIERSVMVAYVGGAAVTGVSASASPPSVSATPASLPGSAALLVAGQRSSVVPGGLAAIGSPWVLDENSGDAQFVSVRVYHWLDMDATSTPAATAAPGGTGGVDEVDAAILTIVGLG